MSLINSKQYWNCTTWKFIRRYRCPNDKKLKTMVKRSIDQKLRSRNFDARHEKIETRAVVKSCKKICVALKEEEAFVTSGKKQGSVRRRINAVSGMRVMIVQKPTPKAAPPSEPPTRKTRICSASRKRSVRGRSQSGKFNRQPCKYFLKGTCTKSPCEIWHPPECQFYKSESGCKFGAECLFPHWKVEKQPNKRPKKELSKRKERRQGCCSYWRKLYLNWVVSRKTPSRQNFRKE